MGEVAACSSVLTVKPPPKIGMSLGTDEYTKNISNQFQRFCDGRRDCEDGSDEITGNVTMTDVRVNKAG